jgi:hypothetical protein
LVRDSIHWIALRLFSPEIAAISTEPSSSTLISVPVSSWILRIIEPPLPMISRIFSGLILIVTIRGANSLISSRAVGQDANHLVEDLEPGVERLGQAAPDDRLVDALDLDVHLEGGDPVPGAGDLEVHVTEGVFLAQDVGQHGERPSGSEIRPIAAPATGALIGTPASIRARVEPQVEAIEVEPLEVTHSLTSRMTYGNSSWLGRTGRSARSARWPWPISRRPGPRIILFSPVLYGGML